MQTLIFSSCEFVHIFSFDLPTDQIKALICRNWAKLRCFMSSAALYKTRQCGRGNWGMIKPQQQTQSLASKANYKGFIFAIAAILWKWNIYSYVLLSYLYLSSANLFTHLLVSRGHCEFQKLSSLIFLHPGARGYGECASLLASSWAHPQKHSEK